MIPLLHMRSITSNGTYISKSCNNTNGDITIVAQIVGVNEDMYTSQVTISDMASMSSLIGKSVECVHDNGTAVEAVRSFIINNISYPSRLFL